MTETAKIKDTLIDRVINYFDPIRGQQRHRARSFMALTGAYTGALLGRRTLGSWGVTPQDADSALLPDLKVLRERSRDLVRNNPLGTGASDLKKSEIELQKEDFNRMQEIADRAIKLSEQGEKSPWTEVLEWVIRILAFGAGLAAGR